MIEELLVEDGSKVVAGQELFKIRLTEGGMYEGQCSVPCPNVRRRCILLFVWFVYLFILCAQVADGFCHNFPTNSMLGLQ